jgi:hypothetical protein
VTAACRTASVALLALVALAAHAHAQQPSPNTVAADQAFKQGRELFKAGKYADACEQFARSQQLDPAHGTLFNLSQCSERIGKLATAAAGYRELVANDTNEQRKATAAERLKDITPRIPKLVVHIDNPPPGLDVEIDSKDGPRNIPANTPVEVDFGDYSVVARARGHTEIISRVNIVQEGKTTTVEGTLVRGASNSESIGVRKHDQAAPAPSHRKLYALGALGTGGAAVVGGVVLGALARSSWNEAKDVCGGTTCTTQADLDRANELGDAARTKATLSTILVIGGAVVGGVGAYLLVTTPGGTTIAPTATDSSAGVSISGSF